MRIAVGEGIEPGAEDHILPHAVPNGLREFVLGIAAARRHERPERTGESMVLLWVRSQLFGSVCSYNPQRQWIVEHPGLVKKLVRGSSDRHPMRGSAEFTFFHAQNKLSVARTYSSLPTRAALHSSHGQTSRRNFQE